LPSHRKPKLNAARNRARTLTLCAATLGTAALPAIASAATGSTAATASHSSVQPAPETAFVQAAAVQTAAVHTAATAVSDTAGTTSYTVQSGDTLFGIASRSLGSGEKYHQLFKLNRGRTEADGSHLTNANLIRVGWTILLPPGAKSAVVTAAPAVATTPPAAAQAPAPAPSSSSSDSSSSSSDSSSSASSSNSDSSSSSSSSDSSSPATTDDSSSSGYADDLDGWINQAISILADNGYSVSYNAIYETAMNESGGDANAENDWDSNAAAGTPSIGLMQVIQPTFAAYTLPGYDDIWNPVDNIIAAVIYAQDTYGGLDNVVADRCGGSCWSGY
jgi:Transglycosylase SLT domain/LysM domain